MLKACELPAPLFSFTNGRRSNIEYSRVCNNPSALAARQPMQRTWPERRKGLANDFYCRQDAVLDDVRLMSRRQSSLLPTWQGSIALSANETIYRTPEVEITLHSLPPDGFCAPAPKIYTCAIVGIESHICVTQTA